MPEQTEQPRGRGRPRNLARRPEGARQRVYYTTDAEQAAIEAAATRAGPAGVTVQEWARRVLLAAAEKARR